MTFQFIKRDIDNFISSDNEKQNNAKYFYKSFPYKTQIKKIYHLSDFHIQLYKKHSEYQIVFDKVINYLKEEKIKESIPLNQNSNIHIIALITGDILHSKSDLSPECP